MSGTPVEVYPPRSSASPVPSWADINPKVTASALGYAWSVAGFAVAGEYGIDITAVTQVAVSGAVMLTMGYLMPSGRHDGRA